MEAIFFKENRQRLIDTLGGGVVALRAYTRLQRSNDMAHAFTQEANFWYLCGITEPDWQLIIDGAANHTYLIAPDVKDIHRIFDGGINDQDAKAISGVDSIMSADEGRLLLRTLAKKHSLVYSLNPSTHAEHFNFTLNPAISENKQNLSRLFAQVQDITKQLAKLRAIKSDTEINHIQKAVDITVSAFQKVHRTMKTYRNEFEVEAEFTSIIRKAGAAGHAYDPIVAAGINACTLHYSQNSQKIESGQLVLMDIGASFDGYAADITRTFIKGKPTKRQKTVHEAVQAAHSEIISLLEPHYSVIEYHQAVEKIMTEALRKIGLYRNDESLRRYFPHAISHGLGIDVHDSLGAPSFFQPGMVLTVEPGIYIPEEKIGIRIEDDILITDHGNRNLSEKLSTGM